MRIGFLTLLFAFSMCVIFPAARAQERGKSCAPASKAVLAYNERFVAELIELTNVERVKAGLAPVKRQDDLSRAARWQAEDMASGNYFDHKDHLGRHIEPRLPDFGYVGYCALGENIAGGQTSPAEVVAGWMKSPGHRANLLNPDFREVGVAYVHAPNSEYQDYWVQDFGSRSEVFPLIINLEAVQTATPSVKLYVHGGPWAQQARYSNDNQHWTEWEDYQATREWTLAPADGRQTVYVELRNGKDCKRQTATIALVTRTASATTPDKKQAAR